MAESSPAGWLLLTAARQWDWGYTMSAQEPRRTRHGAVCNSGAGAGVPQTPHRLCLQHAVGTWLISGLSCLPPARLHTTQLSAYLRAVGGTSFLGSLLQLLCFEFLVVLLLLDRGLGSDILHHRRLPLRHLCLLPGTRGSGRACGGRIIGY